jgi:hypothetical protein
MFDLDSSYIDRHEMISSINIIINKTTIINNQYPFQSKYSPTRHLLVSGIWISELRTTKVIDLVISQD